MKPCRLCGGAGTFIQAHVIPEAFFRPLRIKGETPLLVVGVQGALPKRAHIGVYDKKLLCASCETKFSSADTYGTDVLLTGFERHFKELQRENHTIAYEGSGVDKLRLLEFLVSVLWRASASGEAFYKNVRLGVHEKLAKDTLFVSPVFIPSVFDAVLTRWSEVDVDGMPTTAVLNPHREKWGGINAYRIYLGKVVAHIKVDQRPFAQPFASMSLQASGPCRLVTRALSHSKDIVAMQEIVITAESNRKVQKGRAKE